MSKNLRRKLKEKVRGNCEENQEEVEEEANEGEMLVLRRVLNGHKGAKDEQRESIFRTRCTVKDKVCSLIIDGRSCANVVSLSMIEKLGLQATSHPHPYNIQWLNQSKGLQVNSTYLISLSIGKNFQAELWCNVIPMDARHVLFGRPTIKNYSNLIRTGFLIALKTFFLSVILKLAKCQLLFFSIMKILLA